MSSMLKKTGGLAFKPKALGRRGAGGSASATSSQPATSTTTTRAPTTEPQQPVAEAPSLTPPATIFSGRDETTTSNTAVESESPAPSNSNTTRIPPPTPDSTQSSVASSAPKTTISSTPRSSARRQQQTRPGPETTQSTDVPAVIAPTSGGDATVNRPSVDNVQTGAKADRTTATTPATLTTPSATPAVLATQATTPSNAPAVQEPPATSVVPRKKRAYTRRKPRETVENGAQSTPADGTAPPRKRAKSQRRKRTSTADGEGATAEEGTTPTAADNRATPKPSKRRRRSPTPEDAVNVKVDHTAVKMSELTRDLGIGAPFKHAEAIAERAREARNRARLRKLEKDKIRMGLLPDPGDDINGSHKRDASQGISKSRLGSSAPESGGATSAEPAGPGYIVVDGQIIINQQSLMIDNHASAENDISNMRTVVEDDFTHLTTAASFMRESRVMGANSWTEDETEKFYIYLQMFGTDFETISHMFPGKNRRMVKLKFNREERLRPNRINAAVSPRNGRDVAIDLDHYKERRNNWQEADEIMKEHDALVAEHNIEVQRLKAERRAQGLADDDDDDPAQSRAPGDTAAGSGGDATTTNAVGGDPVDDQDLAEHNNEHNENEHTDAHTNPMAVAAAG